MRIKVITAVLLLVATTAMAQDVKKAKAPKDAPPRDNYDQLLQEYLQSARLAAQPTPSAPDSSWMTGLFGDLRAHRVNDLVTINVVETLSATGSADSTLDKNSKATAAVPNLFGVESKFPGFLDPSSLATLGANTSFKGSGSTARSGSLS